MNKLELGRLSVVRAMVSRRWAMIGLVLAAEIAVYCVFASAGKWPWPRYMEYYDLQAEGFRAGHLYIPTEPHPELLKKANPYDPSHIKLWFWDVTLYEGRYYMYWGPVPGLIQAAVKILLGFPRKHMIGDQYIVFVAFVVAAVSGALIIERLQRRLYPDIPLWAVLLAMLAFGMANPAPYLVATAGVYQASISAAQAFLLLGLVFAFDAVWRARTTLTTRWRLMLAGSLWALAIGSRISVLPAAIVILFCTALACACDSKQSLRAQWWSFVESVLALGVPLGIGFVALLIYNKLRFDSFTEFGTNLQLSTLKFRLSTDYWLANLYTYVFRPYEAACEFPYALAQWFPPAQDALAGWIGVPQGYLINEPVVGWARVVVVAWWGPVALVSAYRRARETWRKWRLGQQVDSSDVSFLFCVTAFLTLGVVTAFILLGMYMATMRYLADATNGLVLLGVLGAFTVLTTRRSAWGMLLARCLFGASVAATVTFGMLLGYQGYNGHFKRFNPQLDALLQKSLATCDAAALPEKKRK